jgi:membrane protease YdiL (CAAX protease family)
MTQAGSSTRSPALREAGVFLAIAYVLALAIAIALPRAGIAPLISLLMPVVAVAITVLVVLPRGRRRAAWAEVGFGLPPWRPMLVGVVGSMAILALSYLIAAGIGVVRFAAPDGGIGGWALELVLTLVVFGVVLLGEEIGWRGFLLLRLCAVMPGRRAVLATGACQAAFHLPLLTLTTTYQSEGSRWIVVPVVMATLTLAGVWYGWLRLWSGSIWPVSYAHSAFNAALQGGPRVVIATSPAAMAYTTTETGVVTLLIVLVTAVYLLTRRAADFRVHR